MKRKHVYKLIDSEREYQLDKWGDDRNESIGNFLTYMQVYLDRAKVALTDAQGDEAALNVIRKVTTLGVACMERFGAPSRE